MWFISSGLVLFYEVQTVLAPPQEMRLLEHRCSWCLDGPHENPDSAASSSAAWGRYWVLCLVKGSKQNKDASTGVCSFFKATVSAEILNSWKVWVFRVCSIVSQKCYIFRSSSSSLVVTYTPLLDRFLIFEPWWACILSYTYIRVYVCCYLAARSCGLWWTGG